MPMPEPTHACEPSDGLLPWVTLRQALCGLKDRDPAYSELSPSKKRFLKLVPWRLAKAAAVAVVAVVVVAAAAVAAGGKNHEQETSEHEQNKLNSSYCHLA